MILKNEITGETIKVCTPEDAYDAFCVLNGEDFPVYGDKDLDFLAQKAIDSDKDYHKAQELYILVTEVKNEQIVLADKLDQIAKLQKHEMDEKFAKLQEISKEFNKLYEMLEDESDDVGLNEEDYEEEVDCGYDCKSCGYNDCPERMAESQIEYDSSDAQIKCVAPYNSAKSSFKLGDNYVELEARWNAPVSDDAWEYVIEKLSEQI